MNRLRILPGVHKTGYGIMQLYRSGFKAPDLVQGQGVPPELEAERTRKYVSISTHAGRLAIGPEMGF